MTIRNANPALDRREPLGALSYPRRTCRPAVEIDLGDDRRQLLVQDTKTGDKALILRSEEGEAHCRLEGDAVIDLINALTDRYHPGDFGR